MAIAAATLMDELDGGPVAVADGGSVDAVDLKGIDPAVILGQLVGLARGVPWNVDLVAPELLWSRDEEAGPWLIAIGDAARDALASISEAQVPELSRHWGQTEELAWDGPLPDDEMIPVIDQIAGLARRAHNSGHHLFCWSSL